MKNNKIKRITVSIASVPDREDGLETVIKSLIDQVDYLNIYLNNYQSVPSFLKNVKIKIFRSQDYRDLGDIGKFYFCENIKGYHFTCDDDIIYPSNYVEFMLSKLKIHNGFISCHGAIFNNPFYSFYKSKTTFHFRERIKNDISVNLVGTGVMAYDADIQMPKRFCLVLTNLCNLACDFCYQIRTKQKNALDSKAWIKLIKELPENSRVSLTGGEPLVFKNFKEVFTETAKRHECNLICNGLLLTEDIIDHLLSFKSFKVLSISIDNRKNTIRKDGE